MNVRWFMACLFVLGCGAAPAEAQGLGYAIVGPAGVMGTSGSAGLAGHGAGGAELLVRNRVGAGGEFGVFAGEGGGLYIASVNGVLHFAPVRRERGTRPFVSGGYTRLSNGEGTFNGYNIGGGVDIWARERAGVRVEIRDHIRPDDRGTIHYWAIRAGVVFR